MNLSGAVGNYLNAWEGHSSLHGEMLHILTNIILIATMDEIKTQYNVLSQQKLWTTSLIDVFHDEILNRLLTESSFLISTSWTTTEEWKSEPYVTIKIGFEDTQFLTDKYGNVIPEDDENLKTFSLSSNDFSQNTQDNIVRMILRNNILAAVETNDNTIQVIGISNIQDSNELVPFINNVVGLSSLFGQSGYQLFSIPAKVDESEDFSTLKQILKGLSTQTFNIIDEYIDINTLQL